MRTRYCRTCGDWHEPDKWPSECYVIVERASSDTLACPMFISDTIEPLQSMADGKTYSSKSALRNTYKPSGNPDGISYVEMGNEKPKPIKKDTDSHSKSVRDSVAMARARVGI